jgi:hypothetical protein
MLLVVPQRTLKSLLQGVPSRFGTTAEGLICPARLLAVACGGSLRDRTLSPAPLTRGFVDSIFIYLLPPVFGLTGPYDNDLNSSSRRCAQTGPITRGSRRRPGMVLAGQRGVSGW